MVVMKANTVPIGCTQRLATICPRTKWAKLVVIPQVGQGNPVRDSN
jgi:hypothetical protein